MYKFALYSLKLSHVLQLDLGVLMEVAFILEFALFQNTWKSPLLSEEKERSSPHINRGYKKGEQKNQTKIVNKDLLCAQKSNESSRKS